jgi:hypothetical protein
MGNDLTGIQRNGIPRKKNGATPSRICNLLISLRFEQLDNHTLATGGNASPTTAPSEVANRQRSRRPFVLFCNKGCWFTLQYQRSLSLHEGAHAYFAKKAVVDR